MERIGGCLKSAVMFVGIGILIMVVLGVVALALQSVGSAGSSAAARTPTAVPSKSDAVYLDPRVLASDPAAHVGKNIRLVGRSINVDQKRDGNPPYTWINLSAEVRDRSTTENLVVEIRPLDASVIRDECYTVYGIVGGTQKVTRTLTGATNEVAYVNAYAVEPAARLSFGCAKP